MTHVWIMRKKNRPSVGTSKSALVRADAITHLSMYESQVRASELGSDEVAVLVDTADGGHEAPPLPDDFHLTLLFAVSEARRNARDATDANEEDRVLVAQLDDGNWACGSSGRPSRNRSRADDANRTRTEPQGGPGAPYVQRSPSSCQKRAPGAGSRSSSEYGMAKDSCCSDGSEYLPRTRPI
ncbi:hypothetical protein [Streptomyces sp. NPDC057623]|uniref:hypothetical protein n=1 Tax=Streptomyces sp. NPDC057623 TaxID=3346187 RepID=UPI0036BD2588